MAASSPLPRRRRYTVRILIGIAALLGVFAIFALFANRQLLNSDNWSDTSSAMLADPAIRTQLSNYLVDELYNDVDVAQQVSGALPPRLQPLAGPITGGLRELALRTTNTLLGRPRVQDLWKAANKATAEQFINIAENKSKAISQQGNAVVLDLRVVLVQLIARLGLPSSLSDKLPPEAGKIKILTGNQVSTLQNGANALHGLAVVLPALALGLLALAVYLAAGRRREELMIAGVTLIAIGALVLIVRRAAGHGVVDSLVKQDSVKPAAQAAWDIGTRLLQQAAQATVVIGIPLVLASWLAGGTRPARAFRSIAAPTMRDQVGVTYAVVGAIVVLILAWGPIPATRMLIPVLIMIGLTIFGVEALRRQTAVEYPAVAAPAALGNGQPTEPEKAAIT